jgi:hypothetical protein
VREEIAFIFVRREPSPAWEPVKRFARTRPVEMVEPIICVLLLLSAFGCTVRELVRTVVREAVILRGLLEDVRLAVCWFTPRRSELLVPEFMTIFTAEFTGALIVIGFCPGFDVKPRVNGVFCALRVFEFIVTPPR